MKVITKATANRLKNALPQLLSISQSAFIPGRLISDNILLVHELMHYIKTRPTGGAGYYCVKLDMSKAYDRVRCDFLEAIQPPASSLLITNLYSALDISLTMALTLKTAADNSVLTPLCHNKFLAYQIHLML
ncbi:hypothetical protein QQ045_015465 [Rhodiola kirilowii]